jgi:hypothetical protein
LSTAVSSSSAVTTQTAMAYQPGESANASTTTVDTASSANADVE